MYDSLHDKFTAYLADNKAEITIFLTNGVKLTGVLTFSDHRAVTLARDGVTQLIFKHAIATVMPKDDISIYDIMGETVSG